MSSPVRTIAMSAIIGAVINTIIWVIANLVSPLTIPIFPVPIASTVGAVFGGLFYLLVSRFSKNPNPIFIVVASIVLILTAFSPISAMTNPPPGSDPFNLATVIATELMHVVSGGLCIYFYTKKAII